ncbi:sensor histidine kinase [Pengzhenrongella phosphoraccumulans]|uniref:sensor histidine kinase n=1 Tax=Pengzhenrongella phosphoraccumulans TaxID=3114394 RepID=UPI0038902F5B
MDVVEPVTVAPALTSMRTRLSVFWRAVDYVRAAGWVLSLGFAAMVAMLLLITPLELPESAFGVWPLVAREVGSRLDGAFVPVALVANVSVIVGIVLARRSAALGIVLTTWPFALIAVYGTFLWAWWLGLAAVAVCVALTRPWWALVPYAFAVAVSVVFNGANLIALFPSGEGSLGGPGGWGYVVGYSAYSGGAVAVSAAIGIAFRARTRAEYARRTERRALVVESTAAERARLARDLHDVVAHHVSLVAVRAESAPYLHPGMGAEAREVLREIAVDARSALGELRQVLTILQRAEGAELGPQPGADDVGALVGEAQAAGQQVTVVGTWSRVPAAQGYVLYRAAQEGLTNARRHAPGAFATLTLEQGESLVGFRLTNLVPMPSRDSDSGRGLLGMQERVASLGGTLTAGIEDGTFILVVTLPVATR